MSAETHKARVPGRRMRPAYDRWRDVDGIHVPVGAWVEQAGVDARMGEPRSRLHKRGEVIGRGTTRLRVRFDCEDQTISIRPHLVRVRPRLLSADQVIERIGELRTLIPGSAGR